MTISHRPGLLKYHGYLLKIGEGEGTNWEWTRVGSPQDIVESVENEIITLKERLQATQGVKMRLGAINTPAEKLLHARRSLV